MHPRKQIINAMTDIEIYPSREKQSGRMWGGQAKAVVNGITVGLELWYHGGDNETIESLRSHFHIKMLNDEDFNWHCVMREDGIWFHKNGWFSDRELEKKIFTDSWRSKSVEDLASLGFVNVIPNKDVFIKNDEGYTVPNASFCQMTASYPPVSGCMPYTNLIYELMQHGY